MDQFPFEERLAYASTIPSHWYTDAAVFRNEIERVFHRNWQLSGRAESVAGPGQYLSAQVGEEPVLIVRGADQKLRALSNVCRHRAGPVAAGAGRRNALQCGYHGWTYGLDGRLLHCPDFEGVQQFAKEQHSLPEFRVDTWGGFVFVNLNSGCPPLEDTVHGVQQLPEYALMARKDWRLACNWKVYVDNYLEGYHIPIVHPALNQELDYEGYKTEIHANYSVQRSPMRRGELSGEAQYFWIYPNLMINVYPDHFSTNLVVPLGPDRTKTVFEWYFPKADKSSVDETVSISDRIQFEDIAICESVQQGLRSRTYSSGRYCAQRESGVHHFHGLLRKAMGTAAGTQKPGARGSP